MTELSPRARALIEAAARHEELPSAAQIGRVRRSVLRGLATTGAAVGAASTTSLFAKAAALGSGVTAQVAAYALAGAVAGGAVLAVHAEVARDDRPTTGVATPAVARGKPTAPGMRSLPREIEPSIPEVPAPRISSTETSTPIATPPFVAPAPTVASAPVPALRSPIEATATDRETAAPVPSEVPTPKYGASNDLARQLELLHGMRTELRAGHAQRVLEIARDSEALFAGSALEAESRAARIGALCQLGRIAEAESEIERFRHAFPSSALLRGVEAACSGAVPGARSR